VEGYFAPGIHFPSLKAVPSCWLFKCAPVPFQKVLVGEESDFLSVLKIHPCCLDSCWLFFFQRVRAKQFLKAWSMYNVLSQA